MYSLQYLEQKLKCSVRSSYLELMVFQDGKLEQCQQLLTSASKTINTNSEILNKGSFIFKGTSKPKHL